MAVTSKHVQPGSTALRGFMPEGPLCFHQVCRARGRARGPAQTAGGGSCWGGGAARPRRQGWAAESPKSGFLSAPTSPNA